MAKYSVMILLTGRVTKQKARASAAGIDHIGHPKADPQIWLKARTRRAATGP